MNERWMFLNEVIKYRGFHNILGVSSRAAEF